MVQNNHLQHPGLPLLQARLQKPKLLETANLQHLSTLSHTVTEKKIGIFFPTGFSRYLNNAHDIERPPDQASYCTMIAVVLWMASLCSTFFIVSMTFERFYSIIQPHKAASFNTVKRAKIIIACSVIFSVIYNVPHVFTTTNEGKRVGPLAKLW